MTDFPVTGLPELLRAEFEQFLQWSTQHALDQGAKITQPLYHYTNAAGLRGIIETQKLWFTSYLHLNDPSELTHGMNAAQEMLKEISDGATDEMVKVFCAKVDDLFQHNKLAEVYGFYIASLSYADDDLGQWRAYADNGRGFALGVAPHLFDDGGLGGPYLVLPVLYGPDAERHYRAPIEAATNVIRANSAHLSDETISERFMRFVGYELIAMHLIPLSLSVKHKAYSHEKEVRLVIARGRKELIDQVKTRIRGPELVPYLESDLPLRNGDGIVDVVIGPAAGPTVKDAVHRLLESFAVDPANRVRQSGIPYRAF